MKLVLDTNIVISALIWGSKPYELIRAATEGDIELYTSPALLAELQDQFTTSIVKSRDLDATAQPVCRSLDKSLSGVRCWR